MTVKELYGLFREATYATKRRTPPALLLAMINEGQSEFVDKTLCLKGEPVSRLTMVGKQTYSFSADRGYLVDAAYKWTNSATTSGEWHIELAGGGDPGLSEPDALHMDGSELTEGTMGALADHEWAWGDQDTLSYSTVYLRDDTGDPDTSGVEILVEPGGFGISNLLRPIHFRYDGDDITDYELSISEIGIDETTQSYQRWAVWNGTLYLDPLPTAAKTIQIWPALKPTVLTLGTETPDIDAKYHGHLLSYLLWKHYDGTGNDKTKAKDAERMYRQGVDEAFAMVKTRGKTGTSAVRSI